MKIREIIVKDFMKWRKSWRIDGFGDGVCKLVEENEYGKSTILAALKGIIQYRHGSTVAQKNFRPTGDKVSPEVTVLFEAGGRDVKIWKKFGGQSGRAMLEVDGRRFEEIGGALSLLAKLEPMREHLGALKAGRQAGLDHRLPDFFRS